MHPLVVICHNNHGYVANTIAQADAFGLRVIVLDNASTYEKTRDYLRSLKKTTTEVRHLPNNFGSTCWMRSFVYDDLPDRFFLTDPDLQWNPKLPADFASQLDALCTEFRARTVGFALDHLSDRAAMFQDGDYFGDKTIWDWEAQFWALRVPHAVHELYAAPIDTTFQLRDKMGTDGSFRIAGAFTAKHLPWYRDTSIPPHDLLHMYAQTSAVSTISKLVLREMIRTCVLGMAIDACEAACPEPLELTSAQIKECLR